MIIDYTYIDDKISKKLKKHLKTARQVRNHVSRLSS